jgi:hypothetical protein
MADELNHTEQGQIERAQRLRAKIDRLKKGIPDDQPGHPESLKEQIDDRAAEFDKPAKQ